jgi:hypothetical protein
MKRCPQCNFIYLDTDEVCDLDQTQLIVVDEPEGEASPDDLKEHIADQNSVPEDVVAVAPTSVSRRRAPLVAIALGVLTIAFILGVAYFATARRARHARAPEIANREVGVVKPAEIDLTPSPIESATPALEASPSPSVRTSPSPQSGTVRVTVSSEPVSTDTQPPKAGAVTIRLVNGARIDADEVWRTKDGVWYRRNGVVTLLKRNQVRAIERVQR